MSKSAALSSRLVQVPNDSERHIPKKYVGHPIAPNYYCRGWNGKRNKYCRQRAGAGTEHVGQGRCRTHNGDAPIIHGMSRRYNFRTKSIQERFERHAADTAPMDIREEIAGLRALAEEAGAKRRPNAEAVARLLIEVTKAAERLHVMSTRSAVSMDQLKRIMFAIDRILETFLSDQQELLDKIKHSIMTGVGL